MAISAEQCVALLRDALSNRPTDTYSDEALEWFADVIGIVSAYDRPAAVPLSFCMGAISDISGPAANPFTANSRDQACTRFMAETRAIYTRLRLSTNTFVTRQVEHGQVHDYFEEIRRIITGADADILFLDAYIDPEFLTRYLPQVPASVRVRLLTSAKSASRLADALRLWLQQHGGNVELRSVSNGSLHDRHLVIDGRDVYQSGASFKDGAKHAPTSINQVVDVAAEMIAAHEARWAAAQPLV